MTDSPVFREYVERGQNKAVRSWEKLFDNGHPPAFRQSPVNLSQRSVIDEFSPTIFNASSARKGNFGEIGADLDLNAKGYTSLQPRIYDIDAPGYNGIDGVYKKSDQYFVVEAKYTGSASLSPADPTTGLPRQMSKEWIERPGELARAVGDPTVANSIIVTGYSRVLAKVAPDGSVSYRLIDEFGYVIRGNDGNFNP